MKLFTNLFSLLGVFLCIAVAFFTMKGWTQDYIYFESVKSEMGFTIMMIFIAIILLLSVIVPDKKK